MIYLISRFLLILDRGFQKIQKFELNLSFVTSRVFNLLVSLGGISHHIQDLRIHGSNKIDKRNVKAITQLIKSQQKPPFVLLNRMGSKFTPILETLSSI